MCLVGEDEGEKRKIKKRKKKTKERMRKGMRKKNSANKFKKRIKKEGEGSGSKKAVSNPRGNYYINSSYLSDIYVIWIKHEDTSKRGGVK